METIPSEELGDKESDKILRKSFQENFKEMEINRENMKDPKLKESYIPGVVKNWTRLRRRHPSM